MLILSRRIGEKIIINENIEVKLLSIGKGKYCKRARIGISAPKNISVFREEIYDKIIQKLQEEKSEE